MFSQAIANENDNYCLLKFHLIYVFNAHIPLSSLNNILITFIACIKKNYSHHKMDVHCTHISSIIFTHASHIHLIRYWWFEKLHLFNNPDSKTILKLWIIFDLYVSSWIQTCFFRWFVKRVVLIHLSKQSQFFNSSLCSSCWRDYRFSTPLKVLFKWCTVF